MGLFDKKYCDICGEKIGLLGNRKLENGNLCKNCAKKLSPWFSDRRSSTVEEERDQSIWSEGCGAAAVSEAGAAEMPQRGGGGIPAEV